MSIPWFGSEPPPDKSGNSKVNARMGKCVIQSKCAMAVAMAMYCACVCVSVSEMGACLSVAVHVCVCVCLSAGGMRTSVSVCLCVRQPVGNTSPALACDQSCLPLPATNPAPPCNRAPLPGEKTPRAPRTRQPATKPTHSTLREHNAQMPAPTRTKGKPTQQITRNTQQPGPANHRITPQAKQHGATTPGHHPGQCNAAHPLPKKQSVPRPARLTGIDTGG